MSGGMAAACSPTSEVLASALQSAA